jgi:nucleotide-binding universal stress UspA family protein
VKILVCTDGSEQADRAIRMASDMASSSQAAVTLLGIKEPGAEPSAVLEALARGQQFLEGRSIEVESVSKAGDPIDEIAKRTEEMTYDLVVIGAVRKGRRGPFSMSSKAYKIVKLIKPPVLIVMGNPTRIKRVLVCSGGKDYIESAFVLLGKLAQNTAASITLLHVSVQPPAIYSEIRKLEQDTDLLLNSNSELGRTLRREKESLASLGVESEIRLRQGFVLEEILRELRERPYDMIVAGSTLSTGPLRTYVLGDITREIVNHADCPVLIARHGRRPRKLRDILGELWHGNPVKTSQPTSAMPKSQ